VPIYLPALNFQPLPPTLATAATRGESESEMIQRKGEMREINTERLKPTGYIYVFFSCKND